MGAADELCGILEEYSSPTQPPRMIKDTTPCEKKNKDNNCKDYIKRPWWKIWTW
jgi:hypothetical protein